MLTMKRLSLTVPVIAMAVAIAGTSATEAKSRTSTATAAASCSAATLQTYSPGVLTIATDSDAYSPYFVNNNPSNGKGFESAVAYAVAKQLGFTPSQVQWVKEPLESASAPGKKKFDFDINEIAITPALAKDVDVSAPYFTDPLAVVVTKRGPFGSDTTLSGLANAVIGVQLNTTGLQAVTDLIDPVQQAAAYDADADLVAAYKTNQVNALVTDLGTATDLVQSDLHKAKVLGRFAYRGSDSWGLVLQKHSPLTKCVDNAVATVKRQGVVGRLITKWITSEGKIPVLR
jgi:polar amino acid transport system substrate-binding protein